MLQRAERLIRPAKHGLGRSVTDTLAGQIVMEGLLEIKLSPATRAFLARMIAIVPAMVATAFYGSAGACALLVFSQVVLSCSLSQTG